jgi:hypothetical protein
MSAPRYWIAMDWTGHICAAASAEAFTEREFRRRRRRAPCRVDKLEGADAPAYIRDSMRRWREVDDQLLAIAAGADPWPLAIEHEVPTLVIQTLARERKLSRERQDAK